MVYMKESRPKQFGGIVTEYSFEKKEGFKEAKYAMMIMYSDVEPFEILETKGKKVLIRGMESQQVNKIPCQIGGFAGHFENSAQKWVIAPNRKGETFWISLRKDGKFRRVGNQYTTYSLDDEPYKFYDYNF